MRDMDRKEKQNGSRHMVMQTTEVRHRSGQVRQESIRRREDRHRKKHDMKDVDKMLLTQSLENEFHAGNRRKR